MAVALDGTGFNTGVASSINVSLTTTGGAGVIVVCTNGDDSGGGCGTPTGTGLIFTQRGTAYAWTTGNFLQMFNAPYTSNFSGNITVPTFGGGAHSIQAVAFGVSGAGAFDAGTVPATNNGTASLPTGALTFTTNTDNDFIYASGVDSAGDQAHLAAGWTRVIAVTGTQFTVFYKNLPTGTHGAQSFQMDSGDNISNGCIGDALTPSGGPTITLMGAISL